MNIRALMAELAYNDCKTADLAEILGVSKTTVYRKLYGSTDWTRGDIAAISDALSLDCDRIVEIFFPKYKK